MRDRHRGAGCITRQHAGLPFEVVNALRAVGRIETGHVAEQRVQVWDAQGGAHLFRRIRVKLDQATRDGDRVLYLLTNLPLRKASAKRVARLYRKRWTLETAFQHLEAYFHSEINTLGYPKAALFGFCLALVAYNMLAVVMAALRSVHGAETIDQDLSLYYVANDIAQTYHGMMMAIPEDEWRVFSRMRPAEMVATLRELAQKVRLGRSFQFGEGWHSNENPVRFWNSSPRIPKEDVFPMLCLSDSIRHDDPAVQRLLRTIEEAHTLTQLILAVWPLARVLPTTSSKTCSPNVPSGRSAWPPCPQCGGPCGARALPHARSQACWGLSGGDDGSDGVLTGVPSRRWPLWMWPWGCSRISGPAVNSSTWAVPWRSLCRLPRRRGCWAGIVAGTVSPGPCGVGCKRRATGPWQTSRNTCERRRPGARTNARAADGRAGGLAIGAWGRWRDGAVSTDGRPA